MRKGPASFILILGTLAAIAPYNPIGGNPNLHPDPWLVVPGAVIGVIGAYLMGWRVKPPPVPHARRIAWLMIVVLVLLGGMGFVLR